ncbi:MAG: response regulator transcription factor [Clostridia bacterium]|nr:response regulator transcription factor [Clostridia bacterium]
MIETVVAEDSFIAQSFLTNLIGADKEFHIAGVYGDAFKAEEKCLEGGIDLAVLDVMTEGNHSGIAAGRRIRQSSTGTKVVIVTSLVDGEILARAKQGAADSLWYKDHGGADLMDVIRRTMSGEHIFPDNAPSIALGDMFSGDITPRQMQLLRYFVMGYTYDEIAEKLGITERGVRWYMNELLLKGGFKNRHEMLSAILQNKLIVTTLLDS